MSQLMTPVIFFVDDEPNNLTVFEMALPETWEIHVFDNGMEALNCVEKHKPWVVVSDQRMPNITGVEFLELVKKVRPEAIRAIVTGYSDEDLVVESIRRANVREYIRKPWEPDELEITMKKMIDLFLTEEKNRMLVEELKQKEAELTQMNVSLKESVSRETHLRTELEAWAPPFVLEILGENNEGFPMEKDLIGITFDIIKSSEVHDLMIGGQPVRKLIIKDFSELVIKYGGWRESHSGDSAYAHFGLLKEIENPELAALAVAREFRVFLKQLSDLHGVTVECGVGIHYMKNCKVELHRAEIKTPQGTIVQNSFDSTSIDVDLLHRMEALAHKLPGSNVVLSEEVVGRLVRKPENLKEIGDFTFKGQSGPVKLYLVPSYLVKNEDLENLAGSQPELKKVA